MRLALTLSVALLLPALARGAEPVDVRRAVSGGAVLNWTTMEIEASASALGTGVAGSQEATEQQARRQIGPAIASACRAIPINPDLTSTQLADQPELGKVLNNRVKLWAVAEARYYASGRVHLEGRLSLSLFLRPWTLTAASPRPEMPTVSSYTGLVIDARGSGATPAFAPRLLDPEGVELWDGLVWRERVLDVTPVVYVSSATHSAAARAGESPLVVRARRAIGADLVLDGDDLRAVRRHLVGSPALHEGRVVVVIEP